MTVLSDAGLAELYPEYRGPVGPASIDLHVGDALHYWPGYVTRDPRLDQSTWWKDIPTQDLRGPAWVLQPGRRYLAATRERIAIPDDHAGLISARSSWGRDGLAVIQGPAGFLDPGFAGHVTLELSVVGSDLVPWPGAAVCQLVLFRLDRPCERPYTGRYRTQEGITPSRLYLDWETRS